MRTPKYCICCGQSLVEGEMLTLNGYSFNIYTGEPTRTLTCPNWNNSRLHTRLRLIPDAYTDYEEGEWVEWK